MGGYFPCIAWETALRCCRRVPACLPARRASRKDALPAIPISDNFAKDIDVFASIHTVIGRHWSILDLSNERAPSRPAFGEFENATVSFAGIRKRLAAAEIDLEQPFASANFAETDGLTFAIVEDVRRLMQYEIG